MWGMRRCEDEKMRRCEDEKVFYRPPLLEEPCAQTLSGKTFKKSKSHFVELLSWQDLSVNCLFPSAIL